MPTRATDHPHRRVHLCPPLALALLTLAARPAAAEPPTRGAVMEVKYQLDDDGLVSKVDFVIDNRAVDPEDGGRPLINLVVGMALNPMVGHSGEWEEQTYELQDTQLTVSTGALAVESTAEVVTGVVALWAYPSEQSECLGLYGVGDPNCGLPLSVQYDTVLLRYQAEDATAGTPAGWVQAYYDEYLESIADEVEVDSDGRLLFLRDLSSEVTPGIDTDEGSFSPRTPTSEGEGR